MGNGLLKGLAITIGSGLAFAAGRKIGQNSGRRASSGNARHWGIQPLTQHLAALETRLSHAERLAASGSARLSADALQQTVAAVESKLAAQRQDMDVLRQDVRAIELRSAQHIAAISHKIESLESRLPLEIDNTIAGRIREMEERLQDFQDARNRSLETFVETLEAKVLGRISRLETTLFEQSEAIGAMREKSAQTEAGMEKVLAAITRLSDIRNPEPPLPLRVPPSVLAPEPLASGPAVMFDSRQPWDREREVAPVTPVRVLDPGPPPRRSVPFVFSLISISVAVGLQLTRAYRQ